MRAPIRVGHISALVALVSAMLFMMGLFYSALAPLLPGLKHELSLSTFQSGVLVAIYGVGAVFGAIPAALIAMRVGVKPTALTGLAILAVASVGFGLAHSYVALLASRFMQGVGDYGCGTPALAWLFDAVPAARRGEMLGIALGVGTAGAVIGPVFGGIAAATGRAPSFIGIAVVALLLALAAARFPAPAAPPSRRLRVRAALGSRRVRGAMWLNITPALLLGTIGVLAPLQLHDLGVGAGGIAACFGIGAVIGVPLKPLVGRWSDRRGRLRPTRLALLVSIPIVLVIPWLQGEWLALTIVAAALVATGVLLTPVLAMLSDACMETGVSQILAVTLMNLAGAPGMVIGSSGGGAIAQAAGQRAAYAAMAVILVIALLAVSRPMSVTKGTSLRATTKNDP